MKRLKIAEQIAIVLFFAVLIPIVTIGIIIANISQQSVRKELVYSSSTLSNFVASTVQGYFKNANEEMNQIASAIGFFYYDDDVTDYLKEVEHKYNKFANFKIIPSQTLKSRDSVFNPEKSTVKIYANIDDSDVLSADLKTSLLQEYLDNKIADIKYDIYVLDPLNNIVATNDREKSAYDEIVQNLPKDREIGTPVLFSKVKNEPVSYYELNKPDWTIVVKTSPDTAENTIDKARSRIILALALAALFIFIVVGLYTYYLYINIRQLFKGIIAISKGSYDRKIRLLKSIFTPHEIVFLEKEFNYMTKKVAGSYAELSEKNLKLKRLDEFRASLISAISHEFRTPLTNIIGYASRLMRSDIKIDDETKAKSLKVIKHQAQRLSRMVDDLLVIPEIESFNLQLNMQELELGKLLELSIAYANSNDTPFELNIAQDIIPVQADKDRLIQILVNLCDNAIKYNKDNAPIKVSAANVEGKPCLSIINKSDVIPKEMISKLFEKFVRLDSELTRTTRGTGLGLFIVKGLCEAMNISVDILSSEAGFEVILVFNGVPVNEEPKDTEEPSRIPTDEEILNPEKTDIVNELFS